MASAPGVLRSAFDGRRQRRLSGSRSRWTPPGQEASIEMSLALSGWFADRKPRQPGGQQRVALACALSFERRAPARRAASALDQALREQMQIEQPPAQGDRRASPLWATHEQQVLLDWCSTASRFEKGKIEQGSAGAAQGADDAFRGRIPRREHFVKGSRREGGERNPPEPATPPESCNAGGERAPPRSGCGPATLAFDRRHHLQRPISAWRHAAA